METLSGEVASIPPLHVSETGEHETRCSSCRASLTSESSLWAQPGQAAAGAPHLRDGQRKRFSWTCCYTCAGGDWRSSFLFILWMPPWILVHAAEERGLLPQPAVSDGCTAESVPGGRVPWPLHWATLVKPQSGLTCLIGLGYNPLSFPEEYRELFSAVAVMAQGQSFQSGVREANPLLLRDADVLKEDNLLLPRTAFQ